MPRCNSFPEHNFHVFWHCCRVRELWYGTTLWLYFLDLQARRLWIFGIGLSTILAMISGPFLWSLGLFGYPEIEQYLNRGLFQWFYPGFLSVKTRFRVLHPLYQDIQKQKKIRVVFKGKKNVKPKIQSLGLATYRHDFCSVKPPKLELIPLKINITYEERLLLGQ